MKSTAASQFSLHTLERVIPVLGSQLNRVANYVWLTLLGTVLFGIHFFKRDPFLPGSAVIVLFLAVFLWLKHQDQIELSSTPPPNMDPQSYRRQLLVQRLSRRRAMRALVLSLILPVSLFLVPAAINIFHESFSGFLESMFQVSDKRIGASILLIFLLGSIPPAYWFLIEYPVRLLNEMISDTESNIEHDEAVSEKRRIIHLHRQLRNSTTGLAQTYLDSRSEKLRERVIRWQRQATEILHGTERPSAEQLNQAQYKITLIEETVRRAEGERADERSWQWLAIVIILVYLIAIVLFISLQGEDEPLRPLGITPPILLWGIIGGLAAVLYRFYTTEEVIKFRTELRWLIARPIIGVIMAAITCLAVSTGLVVVFFGTTETGSQAADTELLTQPVFYIIAFLAGFSDKFYMGVLNLLDGRLGGNGNETVAGTRQEQAPAGGKAEQVAAEETVVETIVEETAPNDAGTVELNEANELDPENRTGEETLLIEPSAGPKPSTPVPG